MAAGDAARCYLRHRSSEDQEISHNVVDLIFVPASAH